MQGLHCVIWLCLLLSVTLVGGVEMPRFKYTQNNKIVLINSDTWEVGAPNMMAILLPTSKLHITIELAGGDPSDSYRHVMMFKCNQSSRSYSSMDLTSADNNVRQCTKEIPFSVEATNPKKGRYKFFLERSTLNWFESLETKLELRVCILISGGNLCSNSLFVWNFYASTGSVEFLTNEAIEFLHRMNVSSDANETLGQINFIDPQISMSIKSAPAFLRSKILLGAVFSPIDCKNIQFAISYAIVNYNEQLAEQNHNNLKLFYLDLDSGVLHYSKYGLKKSIAVFGAKSKESYDRIVSCGIVSLAGMLFLPYQLVHEKVTDPITKEISSNHPGNKRDCEIPKNINNPMQITFFSGMGTTPLVCPIVCSNETETYRFTRVNADGIEIPLKTASDEELRTETDGMRVYGTGNVIWFPDTLDARHVGQYKCEVSGRTFTFNVQVLAMPSFVFTLQGTETSGSLPSVIYAMEAESLTYSCTSYYNNVTVEVEPVFFSPKTLNENWRELNLTEFNGLINPSGETPVSVQHQQNKTGTTLTITVNKVPSAKGSNNFTHRFACNVSVDSADAAKIGMQSYGVQTGSNVFYIPRPTTDSFDKRQPNNCPEQSCISAGAEFSITLKPELTKYLKEIGVEVIGMFKINGSYLTDIEIIDQKGVMNITFDKETNNLSFKVLPTIGEKVLKELQKHETLTPVFNLRYPSGSEMAGLRLEKERYGVSDVAVDHRDCRFDPNCFYSTEFDINSTLQSVVMSTNSKGSEMSARPRATRTNKKSDKKTNSAVGCKTSWMWPISLSIAVALLI